MQFANGNIYWREKTKIKNTYPYLTHNTSCDVLIIGGGITGAITAYFLAKEGFEVVVAERNIFGFGTTLATTALLEYQLDLNMYKLEKLLGENTAKKIYKLCFDAIGKIEEISKEYADLKIMKVDVDQHEELAREYGIMSIPTFLIFKEGKVANSTIGVQDKEEIMKLLQ